MLGSPEARLSMPEWDLIPSRRAKGLGFRFEDLGFRVEDLGFRA